MLYITKIEQSEEHKHSREHRAGKGLLLTALEREYGITKLPVILKGVNGKPYFPDFNSIHFNISHAAGMAVCAVAPSELGVDIEAARPVREGLLKRVLTDAERKWLRKQQDREDAFIRLWTLKESYVKATGEGIGADMAEVEFSLPAAAGEKIVCNRSGFCFYQCRTVEGAWLSLCMRGVSIPEEMKKPHIIF